MKTGLATDEQNRKKLRRQKINTMTKEEKYYLKKKN